MTRETKSFTYNAMTISLGGSKTPMFALPLSYSNWLLGKGWFFSMLIFDDPRIGGTQFLPYIAVVVKQVYVEINFLSRIAMWKQLYYFVHADFYEIG